MEATAAVSYTLMRAECGNSLNSLVIVQVLLLLRIIAFVAQNLKRTTGLV